MSVTGDQKDPIPHGLKGYRKPWNCRCAKCKAGNAEYQRGVYAARKKTGDGKVTSINARRGKRSESDDSDVPARRRSTVGDMEAAVIAECAAITDAKPTLVVAAKNLGRSVDDLSGNLKVIGLYNSTMKQLMATMAELRGDKEDKRLTGKRKSGGRLATVGALTKVKRGTA